ncbi:MAG: M28 family peptidase [Acidobacteria bacterium]|nr:M28 family peptidase [Acidobacteriota bacterium]
MKRKIALTLALMLIVTASSGQSPSRQMSKDVAIRAPSRINAAQLLEDVKVLADDSMEGRKAGTPGGARARAYVVRRFREAGIKSFGSSYEQPVKLSPERGDGAQQGANVVGYVGGKEKSNLYLVITAHYDHLGVKGGKIYNGADDNASGVAALLAMATYFNRNRPAHSIIFAALDAEEGSGAGGRAFVSSPPVDVRHIVMDVNLDMVSHSDRNELYASGTYHYPFLKPYLDAVAAHAPVKLLLGHDDPAGSKRDDWTTQSDHQAFHREKIPFVYFGVEDHKDYHQPTDDFQTITPDFFTRAVETILDAVKLLDEDLQAVESKRTR